MTELGQRLDPGGFAVRSRIVAILLLAALLGGWPITADGQDVSCANFDAWQWAQAVYESDPEAYQAVLDPDGNDQACEYLTMVGFAPVLWTDAIPADAVPAQVCRVIDGDTFEVTVNGAPDTIRMYHIDTPEETAFAGGPHCGNVLASSFLG